MACRLIANGQGGFAIACGPRRPTRRCSVPNCQHAATKLCDYPVERKGKLGTCDAHLCDGHAKDAGDGKDHCPPHDARVRALDAERSRP